MSTNKENLKQLPSKKVKKNPVAPFNKPLDELLDEYLLNSFNKVNPLSPSKLEVQGYFASFFNENTKSLTDSLNTPFPELTPIKQIEPIEFFSAIDSDPYAADASVIDKLNLPKENQMQVVEEKIKKLSEEEYKEEIKKILEHLGEGRPKTETIKNFFESFTGRVDHYHNLVDAATTIDILCSDLKFNLNTFNSVIKEYPDLKRSHKFLTEEEMSEKLKDFTTQYAKLLKIIKGFDLKKTQAQVLKLEEHIEKQLEKHIEKLLTAIQKAIALMAPKDKIDFFWKLDDQAGIYLPISIFFFKGGLAQKLKLNPETFYTYTNKRKQKKNNVDLSTYPQILFPVPQNPKVDLEIKPAERPAR